MSDLDSSSLKPDLVPTVAIDDLKRVYELTLETRARRSGEPIAISVDAYRKVCTSGSDPHTAWYRIAMFFAIQEFEFLHIEIPGIQNGKASDAVIKAFATIPMSRMARDVNQGLPFDLDELRRLIEKEMAETS